MNHHDEIAAAVEAHAAEKAQAAFLNVAKAASEMTTERMLFLAKSRAHDLNQNDRIGQFEWDEEMMFECMRLTKGDEMKAKLLVSWVKYGEDE